MPSAFNHSRSYATEPETNQKKATERRGGRRWLLQRRAGCVGRFNKGGGSPELVFRFARPSKGDLRSLLCRVLASTLSSLLDAWMVRFQVISPFSR